LNIPFLDLKRLHQDIQQELDSAWNRVCNSGRFILGDEVTAFEAEFAAYCGVKYAISTGNGLDALSLTLRAMNIGTDDEVLIPAHTFIATALAVSAVGATPVTVDVCANTGNIDTRQLETALTPATRCIIAVHLYGQPADMDPICDFAASHSLRVIEDAAQAHGATYKCRHTGTLADAACFSFYPAKNLGALGDGGAIVTSDSALADQLRMLRNYGSRDKYHHEIQGTNSRLDELQAAMLRVKLVHLDAWNNARQQVAAAYSKGLEAIDDLQTPIVPDWAMPAWHLYVLRHPHRDDLLQILKERGIDCQIHYPFTINQSPAYSHTSVSHTSHPHSESWASHCISLPIAPYLSDSEITHVVDSVLDAVASLNGKAATTLVRCIDD
jgi:dTDP-3-amino-3,4,6-trideoxy-alpha-D-glucose transaminase